MSWKRSPIDYIIGKRRRDAVEDIGRYYSDFTGRCFDNYATRSEPNQFTAWDVVAVSALSVQIPAQAAIALIDDAVPNAPAGRLGELLACIPSDATIWDEQDYLAGAEARELWALVKSLPNLARTKTSKLLAAKRPRLFPVYDRYIGQALLVDQNADDWPLWRGLFMEQGSGLLDACDSVARDAGVPGGLSPLRVLDVAIWMSEAPQR